MPHRHRPAQPSAGAPGSDPRQSPVQARHHRTGASAQQGQIFEQVLRGATAGSDPQTVGPGRRPDDRTGSVSDRRDQPLRSDVSRRAVTNRELPADACELAANNGRCRRGTIRSCWQTRYRSFRLGSFRRALQQQIGRATRSRVRLYQSRLTPTSMSKKSTRPPDGEDRKFSVTVHGRRLI